MLGIPAQAAGPIIAAFIAGVLAFLGLLVSKEQKTSEFRQAWIDALRGDIAEVIARSVSIINKVGCITDYEKRDDYEDYLMATLAAARIRLRLNPKEKPSQLILKTLDEFEKIFDGADDPSADEVIPLEKKLLSQSQEVLKSEWRRVRRGEPIFVASKYLAGFAVIASLCALIILVSYPLLDFDAVAVSKQASTSQTK